MPTLFKLAYSLAVALLFVLFVILGTRTFYAAPDAPRYPEPTFGRPPEGPPLKCDPQAGVCFDPATGGEISLAEAQRLNPEQVQEQEELAKAQREFEEKRRAYEDERADYHRNVFILASVLGVAAVAGGLALFRRVEAMPLGLLLGGIGVVIFGWVQSAEDFGEIGMAPLFATVAVGLAVVLAVGYRFLGLARPTGGDSGEG